MFANGFRRRQSGSRQVTGIVMAIVLRLILWPMFALMALVPTIGAGYLAYTAVNEHHPGRLAPLLAGITLLWQFIAVNGVSIAAQMATFDPASLLRFPLRFGRYLILRLALGLLTPSTITGCLALLATAIGITIADRSLALAAFLILAIYAAFNLFVSRTIAIWMERWLSTRRAREIFGGLMALLVVSIQFLNFHRAPVHSAGAQSSWLLNFINGTNHFLVWFPPGFAAGTILPGPFLVHLAELAALLLWTALFFAAFAYRLHKQFLGEYLTEGASRATAPAPSSIKPRPIAAPVTHNVEPTTYNLLSPGTAACLRKEFLYLRSNGNQIIAMITPLIFVFILGRGILARHPSYLLAGAVGYAMLGLLGALYNIFGADGAGVQLYLLAPMRLRDVILAKNIAALTLLTIEALMAWCVVLVMATAPVPFSTQLSTFFWVIFVIFANLSFGTLRSIQAPRKITLAQTRSIRPTTASRTSGLLVLAVLIGGMLLQIPVTFACRYFQNPWLAVAFFAPLAALAVGAYALLLQNADRLILTHRDTFAQELSGS
jgi:ABC-2 type transport system permease protein